MVTIKRTEEYLVHKGVKGMKWGYNDGSRNGRRTAAELSDVKKKAQEMAKNSSAYDVGKDFEGDYDEANNMLKYLGITLDLQSDNEAVVKTMQIYKDMAASKDKYKTQYDWLKTFSNRLASVGYDMDAVTKMLDEKKDDLNKMQTGTGTGNREKSNADWKENDAKTTTSKKKTSTSTKSSNKKDDKTKSKETKTTETSKSKSTKATTKVTRKSTAQIAEDNKKKAKTTTSSTKKSYNYRPSNSYSGSKKYPSRSKVSHSDLNQNGEELYHHGILGQRWGVRRFQNTDGSLTDAGRKHYGYSVNKETAKKVGKAVGTAGAVAGTVAAISSTRSESDKAASRNSTVAKLTGNEPADLDPKEVNKAIGKVNNTAKIANKYIDKYEDAKYKKKLSEMSDEELEKEIEKALPEYRAKELRRQLEQRYTTVVGNPDSTKEGRDKAMQALDVMRDIAIITIAAKPVAKVIGKKVMGV